MSCRVMSFGCFGELSLSAHETSLNRMENSLEAVAGGLSCCRRRSCLDGPCLKPQSPDAACAWRVSYGLGMNFFKFAGFRPAPSAGIVGAFRFAVCRYRENIVVFSCWMGACICPRRTRAENAESRCRIRVALGV